MFVLKEKLRHLSQNRTVRIQLADLLSGYHLGINLAVVNIIPLHYMQF